MAVIRETNGADVIGPDFTSPGVSGGPSTDNADRIRARGGDDEIRVGGGDDRVRGGRGDDQLWGEVGDDRLHGGRGTDEAVYAGSRAAGRASYACGIVARG
jgi:Ca2+-binding RTX toxin-like protein